VLAGIAQPQEKIHMSTAGQSIAGSLGSIVAGNLGTGFASLVAELSADGIGLAEQEAQDFDQFIVDLTQKIEAGEPPQQAWDECWAPYVAQAKSDAWTAAMGALKQVVSAFGGFVDAIKAII
jgi:hypothetical protein